LLFRLINVSPQLSLPLARGWVQTKARWARAER